MAILQSDGVNNATDLILRRNGTEALRLTDTGTVQLTSINNGPLAGFRNAIINGNFDIDQRNNGASVSSGVGALTYTLDRWIVAASTAAVTAIQGAQTSVPYNFLSITGGAGNTAVSIRQRIEARTIREFAGQQVTFSFHIYNATSNATSITVQMDRANAIDNFSTATQFSSTALPSVSNTARQSITVTLPAEARNGVEVRFVTNALTTGIFVLHTVQLEPGPVATPFERRSIGQELALCQRYFQTIDGEYRFDGIYGGGGGVTYAVMWFFHTAMRVLPSVVTVAEVGSNAGGIGWVAKNNNGALGVWEWTNTAIVVSRTKAAIVAASAEL